MARLFEEVGFAVVRLCNTLIINALTLSCLMI